MSEEHVSRVPLFLSFFFFGQPGELAASASRLASISRGLKVPLHKCAVHAKARALSRLTPVPSRKHATGGAGAALRVPVRTRRTRCLAVKIAS